MKKGRYNQGYFRPTNPEKYVGRLDEIRWLSSWELNFMRWCDTNPSVLRWNSEDLHIPYWSNADGKMRWYMMDFVIQMRNADGNIETILVEIKPYSQTKPPRRAGRKKESTFMKECYTWQVNQDKWAAAQKYADENGYIFRILTENELGLK